MPLSAHTGSGHTHHGINELSYLDMFFSRRQTFRLFRLSLVILAAVVACGCGVTRVTTSERTSVEQALIRTSAKKALSRLELESFSGKSFVVSEQFLGGKYHLETPAAIDRLFFASAIAAHLVKSGLKLPDRPDGADLVVYPLIEYSGVDDGEFLLGVPSFALPLPGMQASFPEIALLKRYAQFGRVKFSVFAVERESGKLVFEMSTEPKETYYSRWTALIFFGWRTTNLDAPF